MNEFNQRSRMRDARCMLPLAAVLATACVSQTAMAFTSDDGTLEVNGFVENATYHRENDGIVKMRNTAQLETAKTLGRVGAFSNVGVYGTFRASYDAVDHFNSNYGDSAGGSISMESVATGGSTPWGQSTVSTGTLGFGFDTTRNPNDGLVILGSDLHDTEGGIALGVPVRPCDKDSRGCIDGYMDADSSELRSPEFNDRWDFIRELYVDATLEQDDGTDWSFRLGKQQVIWGRTDLFRVLDVLNPVDYSRHNIYDELEDIRIPMWMLTAEKHFGASETFDDLNLQFVWNFDKFRPHNLGQGGSTYTILDAGNFFRAMNNCWDNGCSVANFAGGNASTDFPEHVIGIREAKMPSWSLDNTQFGIKLEGEAQGVGFSLNALTFRSQLPSLRGGIPTDNPFTAGVKEAQAHPYLIAFDIHFPRVNLIGGSLDLYSDELKSVFRVEAAYTDGEEFANTLEPELYSESDVFRYVVGWDRPTFIPFLNKNRAFLLSAQVFGQYIVDHEEESVNGIDVGIPDEELNHIATFLMKGWYKNDRLSPQLIVAHDFGAQATTLAPSVDWLISDNLQLIFGANIKVGDGPDDDFDDCRSCNPFPPFTGPVGQEGSLALRNLAGYEPLGRFRAGPIGMAQNEDEVQVTLRYRF